MKEDDQTLRGEILEALQHDEAEDGLYFTNLFHLHEEDERPGVRGEEQDIARALKKLVTESVVEMYHDGKDTVYRLKRE
jgi:hypothetical protein